MSLFRTGDTAAVLGVCPHVSLVGSSRGPLPFPWPSGEVERRPFFFTSLPASWAPSTRSPGLLQRAEGVQDTSPWGRRLPWGKRRHGSVWNYPRPARTSPTRWPEPTVDTRFLLFCLSLCRPRQSPCFIPVSAWEDGFRPAGPNVPRLSQPEATTASRPHAWSLRAARAQRHPGGFLGRLGWMPSWPVFLFRRGHCSSGPELTPGAADSNAGVSETSGREPWCPVGPAVLLCCLSR